MNNYKNLLQYKEYIMTTHTEETQTVEVAPKVAKKIVAKKAPVETKEVEIEKNAVSEMTAAITDVVKSSTDTVKDTYTSIETAISDSRIAGNSRAKKITAALFHDNVNETVNNFFGHIGEASAVCATVVCSPMKMAADSANALYKKITA